MLTGQMNDIYVRPRRSPGCAVPIEDLLDQTVAAINRADRVAGTAFGEQVSAVDRVNAEAEDLLAVRADVGEIRRSRQLVSAGCQLVRYSVVSATASVVPQLLTRPNGYGLPDG